MCTMHTSRRSGPRSGNCRIVFNKRHTSLYCKKSTITKLPKRILEIVDDRIFLREQDIEGVYACLSHCWGSQGPALQLTHESMKLFKAGIARSQLPKTFRDAIEICGNFNIGYLWIDAMCIVQNDADDWKEAVATMANIYENAYITIAATASTGTEGGCFQPAYINPQVHKLGSTGLYALELGQIFPAENHLFEESALLDWPLFTRGWVYQERRLSSRIVHFAKHEVFWECDTTIHSEQMERKWRLSCSSEEHNPVKNMDPNPEIRWKTQIESYSGLNFTKFTDRLPALAGIVIREMRRRGDDVYVAGMWKSTLLGDLASYSSTREPRAPGIPTWSWASYPGFVSWIRPLAKRTAELLHLDYAYDGPAQMGTVHGACIRIRGPTLFISANGFQSYDKLVYLVQNELCTFYLRLRGSMMIERRLGSDDKFVVLVLSTDYDYPTQHFSVVGVAILLHETTTGQFEKIGTVELVFGLRRKPDGRSGEIVLKSYFDRLTVREVEII
ncbi:heterokaryon incompatibility protein-domain-containing protein [Paraphoma chrysanthemicola]|nr:heterokaryon incompatibility protein-domain-containing protein [Paraphoma chrysanthemicola]